MVQVLQGMEGGGELGRHRAATAHFDRPAVKI
jgi:hypothetical protein